MRSVLPKYERSFARLDEKIFPGDYSKIQADGKQGTTVIDSIERITDSHYGQQNDFCLTYASQGRVAKRNVCEVR